MIRSLLIGPAVACVIVSFGSGCARSGAEDATPAERPAVAVEVSRVSAGDINQSIAVVGTLAPKFQGDVKAEYSGVISEVYVSEWIHVTKGMLLARFDTREANAALKAATAARMQTEVATTRAARELERTNKLRAAGLATQQNLDDAMSAQQAAQAQLGAVRAQEELARTRLAKADIRAPMDGVIAARSINPGDFVENMGAKKPMFSIVDNRRLELTVSVPSTQAIAVALGQPLSFTTDAVPARTFEGRVSYINPAADEASRTVKVIAVVENADGALKSGYFAKGAIVTGQRKGVLRIPRTALLSWDAAARTGVVFVVNGEKAQRRTISLGPLSETDVEVAGGLSPGDAVVTRGAFNLTDGDRVAAAAAGV